MDINKLVQRYKDEDPEWNVSVLVRWLIERKQIQREIAEFALHQALLELESGLSITSHKGPDGFDNYVLKLARKYGDEIYIETTKTIEENLINKYSEFGKLKQIGRIKKIWKVIKGEL